VVAGGTAPSSAAAEVGDTPAAAAASTIPPGDPAVPFGSSPFLFFGMAVFAFEGAGIILPMQQAMREPSEFKPILRNGMLVITTLYLVFPLLTYVAWGSAIQDMVTANLPQRAPIVITVELLYCAGLFLTFPIMMWPAVQILEGSRLFRALDCCSVGGGGGGGSGGRVQSIVFRTLLVAVVSLAAVCIPKFGLFVGLIGCLSCSMLAFILPALFSLKLDSSERSRPLRWFMVGFGVIGGGISFIVTIVELIEAVAKDAEAGGGAAGGSGPC
jgi:proton-coupled amino acid transporter